MSSSLDTMTTGKRVERKYLVTVAEWTDSSSGIATTNREILGLRTEDSSIEFNPDIETITDIRGITYTDVNKTEPQQDFDPFYLLGGSKLGDYLSTNAVKNDITAYANCFNLYIVEMWEDGSSTTSTSQYKTIKHSNSSIIPTSIGGDSFVSMPIECHFSNLITEGYVTSLDVSESTWFHDSSSD